MFWQSDTPPLGPVNMDAGRSRAASIEQTDMAFFERIWNQKVVQDWIIHKDVLYPWTEIGIISSALLSILLFVNFCVWASSGKVGLLWLVAFFHWVAVGPVWTSRFFLDFDHNRLLICRNYGLSPLWFDFIGVPTARVYFQEPNVFPCSLYRLETEFKTYPAIVYLMCGIAIHKSTAILEGICVFLCLVCISCERLLLMRVARYPTGIVVDLINGIETFSDCYLRTSSVVLFAYSTGGVSLMQIVLPITLYMFSAVCALAIFLEQQNKKTLTRAQLHNLFLKSLYYAIPGSFAGYNFSVHLQHTLDRTRAVEHLKSVTIEVVTRTIMALMYTSFALESVSGREVWNAFFWMAVVLFFSSILVRLSEVNFNRRQQKRRESRHIFGRSTSSNRIISKGHMLESQSPPLPPTTKVYNADMRAPLPLDVDPNSLPAQRQSIFLNDCWVSNPNGSPDVYVESIEVKREPR